MVLLLLLSMILLLSTTGIHGQGSSLPGSSNSRKKNTFPMAGGYTLMDESDLQTPEIIDLATVALAELIVFLEHQEQLKQKKTSSSSSYSFSNALMETVNPTVVSSSSSSSSPMALPMVAAQVARGSRQVVAGMNYNLTIVIVARNATSTTTSSSSYSVLHDQEEEVVVCMGAFDCTLYDHFGERSVTEWGKEVSCHDTAVVERLQWYQDQVHHHDDKNEDKDDVTGDVIEGSVTATTSSALEEEDESSKEDGNHN
jgi:hypothetical protein